MEIEYSRIGAESCSMPAWCGQFRNQGFRGIPWVPKFGTIEISRKIMSLRRNVNITLPPFH